VINFEQALDSRSISPHLKKEKKYSMITRGRKILQIIDGLKAML